MRAISQARESVRPATPPKRKVPGEIKKENGEVSPSEVRKMDAVLAANNLPMERIREIGESDPRLMKAILEMAASKVVTRERPKFGIRGRAASYLNSLSSGGIRNEVAGFLKPANLFPGSSMNFIPQM